LATKTEKNFSGDYVAVVDIPELHRRRTFWRQGNNGWGNGGGDGSPTATAM